MFQVFDNNKPADCKHHKVDASWANSKFDTYAQAHEYALYWLHLDFDCGLVLLLNTPYNYSGYGDMIEIREV